MPLPRKSTRRWLATPAVGGVLLAAPGLAAAVPVISGADGDQWNASPSYLVTPDAGAAFLSWEATNGQVGLSARDDPFTVTLSRELAEGEGSLTVTQRMRGSDDDDARQVVVRRFVIDRTAPGAVRVAGPSAVSSDTPFGVSWTGAEAGASFLWSVVAGDGADPAAPVVQGPVAVTVPRADISGLRPGTHAIRVTQVDRAGNAGPAAVLGVTIVPAPAITAAPPPPAERRPATPSTPPATAPSTTTVIVKLPALRTARLRPRKASVVRVRRPLLRWARGPRGTTIYNVQVFRVGTVQPGAAADGVPLRKVRSTFPRKRSLRAPLLARGACYVWRVWPFRGRAFTRTPLGISHFCVARNARRR